MKRRFFLAIISVFLIALAACSDHLSPTRTADPTISVTPSPSSEPTAIPATVTPVPETASPLPPSPAIPIITPNPAQLERWKEYQSALAKKMMSPLPPEEVLCEWEILGQSGQELYIWVTCEGPIRGNLQHSGGDTPAVIRLAADGTVQGVKLPGISSPWVTDMHKMFPLDVQEKYYRRLINFKELTDHLHWRLEHPDEPPLIVLSATPGP
jgi:hypothetical protein